MEKLINYKIICRSHCARIFFSCTLVALLLLISISPVRGEESPMPNTTDSPIETSLHIQGFIQHNGEMSWLVIRNYSNPTNEDLDFEDIFPIYGAREMQIKNLRVINKSYYY